MEIVSIGSPLLWGGFTAFILAMLALDLGVFHRKAHEIRFKEALSWTFVWVALALIFNFGVYHYFGAQKGMEFLTGYLIEKALSVDNVFVFLVIFSVFAVPAKHQHRILFWGVLGALVMRAIFIFAGAALLQKFHWVIYIFGALLVVTGIKLLVQRNEHVDPEKNPLYRVFKRIIPATKEYHEDKFFVREGGKWLATPLFMVLVAVEASDLVFAVDSIPAIFAVTSDPFIVYTSNVFAILGLRALYFCLAGVMEKFHLLKVGLSFVLIFVGTKMLIIDVYKIPIGLSLVVVTLLLAGSIAASFIWPKKGDDEAAANPAAEAR
jgi:tellurite resistance protein TerC